MITPKSQTLEAALRSMKNKPTRNSEVQIGSWTLEEDKEGRLIAKKGDYILVIGNA
jgi:hypothetical protein